MDEADYCAPQNVYGITKLAATHYASLLGRTGRLPVLTLRLFSPYGPYDEARRLVSATVTHLLRGTTPRLANPEAVRDYVYVDDVIEAILAALPAASQYAGQVYNIGSGQQYSAVEVVKEIAQTIGIPSPQDWGVALSRPWESPVWQAVILKAKRDFGWQPRLTLAQGIVKTVAWFREHLAEYENKL